MNENTHLITDWLISYPTKTRAGYRIDFTQFTKWLEERGHPIDELLIIDRPTIQRWLGHLLDTGRQPSTIRRKASAVWSFYNYAVEEKLIDHNPAEHLRRPKGDPVPKLGLDLEDAQHLLNVARAHSKPAHALIWLMMGLGLRVTEACSATIEDLAENLLTVTVKGGHRKIKPLGPGAHAAITAAIADRTEGPILLNRDKNPLSQRRAWELTIRLASKAGIKNCTPHTLRHTAATLALAAGAPVQDVQQLLGHRSIETTLRYIQGRDILGGTTGAANLLDTTLNPGDEEE